MELSLLDPGNPRLLLLFTPLHICLWLATPLVSRALAALCVHTQRPWHMAGPSCAQQCTLYIAVVCGRRPGQGRDRGGNSLPQTGRAAVAAGPLLVLEGRGGGGRQPL
jgi:hypothetical protein